MIRYLLSLFTVICKPGMIYEYDGSLTELSGDNKNTYYYYDFDFQDGGYLYVSCSKDSVWFLVESGEVNYVYDSDSNGEFEIVK